MTFCTITYSLFGTLQEDSELTICLWRVAQPEATLNVGKLDIKLQFKYIKCNLGLAGIKQKLPSEGYSSWAFGWRIRADAQVGLRDVFAAVQKGVEATDPPGRPDAQIPKGARA